MSLVEGVRDRVAKSEDTASAIDNDEALREASRLADIYADVRPQPFVVPIERFAGLPILGEARLNRE